MDAKNGWWFAEILATNCEKAWTHAGWEDVMQKWCGWLKYMKKEDEKEKMEEMHQQKVEQMIKSAEGSAGLLHKGHEANTTEERNGDLGERRRGYEVIGRM